MGKDEWEAVEGGFVHGIDLVKHIRKLYGDYFDIAVAGFPQHMLLPPDEIAFEMKCLKEKIDAGVNFIFTQMFYDVEIFIAWVKAVRAAGITVPIVPGIAPIQTWNGFIKSTSLSRTEIPRSLLDALAQHLDLVRRDGPLVHLAPDDGLDALHEVDVVLAHERDALARAPRARGAADAMRVGA